MGVVIIGANGMPFHLQIDMGLVGAFVSIVLIDLVLSADNAVVIGMAARGLPEKQRRWAIIGGVFGAVALRIFFAVLFAFLLFETELPGVRVVGGVLLAWIAWRLVVEPPEPEEEEGKEANRLIEAIGIIIAADAVMSLDNMLAVAGASQGELWLIGFGLALSIPLLFVGAALVSRILNQYPWLIWVGGAVIAWVAGDLIVEEPLLSSVFAGVGHTGEEVIAILFVVAILGASYLKQRREAVSA